MIKFNKKMTKEKVLSSMDSGGKLGDKVEEEEEEVVVWEDIALTETDRDLLSLGPGFMVMSKLDRQEMVVEENVTMSKIRWGKRKQGTEYLNVRQE